MKNYQLTILLASLSPKELDRFDLMLRAAYFNSSQRVLSLFTYLRKQHPEYKNIELEGLYKKLFPGGDYSKGTMRNLMAELAELVRQFLRQLELEVDENMAERLLLRQLAKRKVEKAFKQRYELLQKKWPQEERPDRFSSLEKYLLLEQFYHFPYTDRKALSPKHFENTLRYRDRFFVLSLLVNRLEVNSRKLLLEENSPDSPFDSFVEKYIDKLPVKEQSQYKLLLQIVEVQTSRDKKVLDRLVKLYYKEYVNYSGFDRKLILQILMNLMNQVFKERDSKYLRRMYKLYRFGIDKEIFIYDNSLTLTGFLNIIVTASRSSETAWALRFMASHLQYLPTADQAEAEILGKAYIQFEKAEYSEIIANLLSSKIKNAGLGYRWRLLMIKCYTELALQDPKKIKAALSQLQVSERYFLRKKNKAGTTLYLNLIRCARKIIRTIEKDKKGEAPKIRKMISSYPHVSSRNWLLQKVRSLK